MIKVKVSDLRKEVINMHTGEHLGELLDVEIDEQNGKITAIIVHKGEPTFFGLLGSGSELTIPWSKIKRIGPHFILVESDDHSNHHTRNT